MTMRTGGCRCGEIRYELSAAPMFHVACHCRDCQYIAGGSPNLTMVFPAASLKLTRGEPKVFKATEKSGGSYFCASCGVHVFSRPDTDRSIVAVKVGGLDDASDFKVQADMWMASAPPWHHAHEGALRFERNPPR
jgi:hypothetical protein